LPLLRLGSRRPKGAICCTLPPVPDVLPTDEATDEPSDHGSLRPGTRLGRYELLVPIARGGMARVWAARQHGQRGFQKLVAIKTILPNLADEPEFERMFLDEARIASGVHHPNVCEIYELGDEKNTLYLAMEWVSGDSLSRVLRASGKTEALDPRVVARIVADACAGAHAAHDLADEDGRLLDVVHRDLSPHNILLSADGVAKVCDFGVAKALGQLHEQTSAGQLKGKLSYMSPEQITGDPLDRRSDVFSLGCVLYEATTGARPFRGERDHQIMQSVLNGQIEPPSKIVRNYPPELERIVLRALAQQPILRYPSAERMRFALEEFLTKGHLVTQSNVAQAVRSRIGDLLDRRKERIRQASSAAEQSSWDPAAVSSTREAIEHRSGVKAAGDAPPPSYSLEHDDTVHGFGLPSSTLREAASSAVPTTREDDGPRGLGNITDTLPMPVPAPDLEALQQEHVSASLFPSQTVPPSSGMRRQEGPRPAPTESGSVTSDPHPAGPAQYALAAFVGILLAAAIGGGGFYAWRSRTAETRAVVAPPPPAVLPAASPQILIQTTPPDAVVLVDGVTLPPTTRSIPRPPAGRTVTVVMRAKSHEDGSVQVDYFTQSPIVYAMKPILELDAPAVAASTGAVPSAKPHPSRPRSASPAVLPDNPY
jgi:serine/threonine protein kinase